MGRLSLVLLALLIILPAATRASTTKVHVLPFKVWKQKKIDEAKSVVNELRRETKSPGGVKSPEEDDQNSLKNRMTQAELNLGVVRELSANDYFVLYVAPQFKDNPDALKEAAKKLAPQDMADILSAYEKRLQAPDVFGSKDTAGAITGEGGPGLPSASPEPPSL